MIKKMLVCMIVASMLVNPMVFADTTKGDPSTNFHQVQNEGHRKGSHWLVKSIGNNQQILWQDGSVTKVDIVEEILDLTDWRIGSQGNSYEDYRVTYISPTLGAQDQIIVSYNFQTQEVNGATRWTYEPEFTETIYTSSQIIVTEYCGWGICI
ncbi:MAG: hypothetical protein E2O29_01660 [Deltaproteobacteria bacterium]|nr:MAG: hypothetical protein E2O29_01660 [Deltaproteobacteria bacterium]